MAQVGRFRESRLDALASFKLYSWPFYGPLVVPRSVLRLLELGLVWFPASSQPSDSIVEGQEGCKPPDPEPAAGSPAAREPSLSARSREHRGRRHGRHSRLPWSRMWCIDPKTTECTPRLALALGDWFNCSSRVQLHAPKPMRSSHHLHVDPPSLPKQHPRSSGPKRPSHTCGLGGP